MSHSSPSRPGTTGEDSEVGSRLNREECRQERLGRPLCTPAHSYHGRPTLSQLRGPSTGLRQQGMQTRLCVCVSPGSLWDSGCCPCSTCREGFLLHQAGVPVPAPQPRGLRHRGWGAGLPSAQAVWPVHVPQHKACLSAPRATYLQGVTSSHGKSL